MEDDAREKETNELKEYVKSVGLNVKFSNSNGSSDSTEDIEMEEISILNVTEDKDEFDYDSDEKIKKAIDDTDISSEDLNIYEYVESLNLNDEDIGINVTLHNVTSYIIKNIFKFGKSVRKRISALVKLYKTGNITDKELYLILKTIMVVKAIVIKILVLSYNNTTTANIENILRRIIISLETVNIFGNDYISLIIMIVVTMIIITTLTLIIKKIIKYLKN